MRGLGVGICVLLSGCGPSGFGSSTRRSPTRPIPAPPAVGLRGPRDRCASVCPCASASLQRPMRKATRTRLSPDGLTLYFSQGGSGKDYYAARRPDRLSPWGAPSRLDDLSSAEDDTKLTLTDDGLVAILSSNRAPATSFDLWEATRASTAVAFDAPTRTTLAAINNNSAQYDPQLSGDGLRLYLRAGCRRHPSDPARCTQLARGSVRNPVDSALVQARSPIHHRRPTGGSSTRRIRAGRRRCSSRPNDER